MPQRPKSVSFVASSFVLHAVLFLSAAWHRFHLFQSPHGLRHLLFGVLLVVFAGFLLTAARELWRLSEDGRTMGVVLGTAVAALWASILKFHIILAELQADPLPEMIGGVIGLIAATAWVLSPIYILTRPAIVAAFANSGDA